MAHMYSRYPIHEAIAGSAPLAGETRWLVETLADNLVEVKGRAALCRRKEPDNAGPFKTT